MRLTVMDKRLSHCKRIKEIGLKATRVIRRLCGDLIEMFRIFKSFYDVKHTIYFTMLSTCLRRHAFKLHKAQVNLDMTSPEISTILPELTPVIDRQRDRIVMTIAEVTSAKSDTLGCSVYLDRLWKLWIVQSLIHSLLCAQWYRRLATET